MKLFSKIATALVGMAMAVGVGVAVSGNNSKEVRAADDIEITFPGSPSAWTASYTSSFTVTAGGVDFDFSGWNNGAQKDAWTTIRGGQKSSAWEGTITSDQISNAVEKVVVSITQVSNSTGSKLEVASDSSFTTDLQTVNKGAITATGNVEFVVPNLVENSYYRLTFNQSAASNGSIRTNGVTFVAGEIPSGKTMRIQDNYHHAGPFEVTYGDTSEYKYALAWDVDGDTSLNSDCSWEVSDDSVIDYYTDGYTWLCYKPKNVGTTTITVSHADYNTVSTTITVVPGTVTNVAVSGSMTKTSYYVGEAWSNAGLVATATYDSGYVATVTDDATWTWNPAAPATSVVSVTPTATYESVSGVGSAQAVTVSRTNPLQVLYTQADNTNVDVYGVYVGFLDGSGPIIMDGAYGMLCYNKTADVSSYTANETILHVTGKMGTYNGLRQITSPVLAVASGSYDAPDTPVIYAAQGGETVEYSSRLTTVTGTAVCTKNDFSSDAGTNDITMSFTVGSKTVQVFYKKAAQTADAEAYAAMKAAVEDKTEITVKGFTGWYNGFQVQMNGYIPPAEGYTAEEFSQDLLDQTDAVCKDYDDVTNNHDAIEAIWSDLASNDKYPSLPADQKTILAEAARDESGTVVEQAMARYDYLTGKYGLSNFINGRTPVVFAAPSTISSGNNINSSMSIIVVAVIAITSLSAIGVLLVIKRRKSI